MATDALTFYCVSWRKKINRYAQKSEVQAGRIPLTSAFQE